MKVASLEIDLLANISRLQTDMNKAQGIMGNSMGAMEKQAQRAEAAMRSLGRAAVAALGVMSVGAVFSKITKNTIDLANEQAQLGAVLLSTGEAAGWSADQLNSMAAKISQASTVSSGEITKAQTTLLAFTGIVGDQFPRALQAATDMAARTGTSVVSAAETIGRALDIPSQGLTALSKQGFRFTDDQKKLAERLEATGRVAEAQAIILDALSESYGGAADAARNTLGGSIAALGNTLNDLLTATDGSFSPIVDGINALNDALASSKAKEVIEGIVYAAAGLAAIFAGKLVASLATSAIGFVAATAEAVRYQMALARMAGVSATAATAIGGVTAAARAGSLVLGVFGGPLGLVATIGLAAAAFFTMGGSAKGAAIDVDGLAASLRDLSKKQLDLKQIELGKEIEKLEKAGVESGQSIISLGRDLSELGAMAGVTDKELDNVRHTLLEQQVAHEGNNAALEKARAVMLQVVAKLQELDGAARGAAGGISALNAAMSFSTDGEKYLTQIQGRIKALQDGGDPIKTATRWIEDHATATEADKIAIMSAAFAEKALQDARDLAARSMKSSKSAATEAANAYATLTASIAAKTEENRLELAVGEKSTESQKLRIKLDADLAAGKLKLTDAHKVEIDAALKTLAASEAQMSMSTMLAAVGAQKLDLSAAAVKSAYDEARQNELLASTFGMNKSAIEAQTVARLRDALAQAQANKASEEELKALELLIDAHERNAAAMVGIEAKEATKKANDEMAADWKKTVDDYGTVFRDGFALMLNKGEDKWKSFTKSLRTTFATTVADRIYKMFAQPFVVRMVASIIGVGGAGSAAAAGVEALGGTGGSGNSALSLMSAGKNLYSMFTGGFASAGQAITNMGVKLGSQFVADFGYGFGGGANAAATQGGAWGSGVGTASGIAAGVGVGIMGGGLISGQYSAMGSNPNNAVYVGTAIGAAVGSIIPVIGTALGAAVGGILGGVYNRTFGMGKKEYGDTSIVGSLNAGGFSGHNETPWSQKGGLFRSNKSGTAYGVLDGEFAAQLGSAFGLVKSGVAALAMSVGVSADSLAYYSEQIKLTLTGSAEENQKLIEAALSSVGENMIRSIIPTIADYAKESETVAQTLERLSGSLAVANNALGMIRKELLEVSLAGADAAAKLGDVFGGLDQMAQVTQAFYMAVYSEGERATHSLEGMRVALQSVGVSMPRTVLELRDMALAMDLTTDAGRAAYATLLTITPEFAAVAEATKRLAEEMGDALLESFTARGQLVAALDVTALKTMLLRDTLVSTYVAAGNISTLFLDLSSGLITFGGSAAVLDGEMNGAQAASAILADQIAELQAGAAGATIDFAKLTTQLGSIDTNVFVATITKAFEAMAQRIGSLIGDIVSERIAVREAVREIIDPGAMTPEAIRRQIAGINTTLPGNSGVVAAGMKLSAADAVAEQKRRQEEAARNSYLPAQGAYQSAQSAVGPLSAALNEIQAVYDDYQRQIAQPRKYSEGRAYVRDLQAQLPGIEARLNQARADLAAAQGASSGARMDEINALAAAYANAVTESTSAQAAANVAALEAKQSQTSYADALQAFAIDASKSIGKLSTLREETMRYYQAQKQLADLMGTSAAGLRKTAADYRYGQLDPEDQLNKLQADYAKAYAMASSTDGDALVGYADQMNSMLNPMLEKARDVFGSDAEYNAFVATMLARAENIAGRLDILAPADYENESLALLGQIDATLAALEASSRTAEQLVVNAINAGRDATVDALRHIASALGWQGIPAFASGGNHLGGLRLVGEYGPELESTGPSRIFTASQTRSILGGGGNGDTARLEALVERLIQDNADLRIEVRSIAVTNDRLVRQGDRQEIEGMLVRTDAEAPLDIKETA